VKRNASWRSVAGKHLPAPNLDEAKTAVLSGLPSKESQRGYRHVIEESACGTRPQRLHPGNQHPSEQVRWSALDVTGVSRD
jgi:hypothetical protein